MDQLIKIASHNADLWRAQALEFVVSFNLPSIMLEHKAALSAFLLGVALLTGLVLISSSLRSILLFAWNCFLKPVRGSTQAQKLDSFYAGQADVYDDTRAYLLKGRETMLQLVASHVKNQDQERMMAGADHSRKPRIWVDIGGGTGWNVEHMDDYLPISSFDAIYIVDLCKPLLDVAERRFARKGWRNVHCLHQSAESFVLPEWTKKSGGTKMEGSLAVVTMSYSMSMIPTYRETLDRVRQALDSQHGFLGVVDFYATSKAEGACHDKANGTLNLETTRLNAWFWKRWFAFDHVHLGIERRNYLQESFSTRKIFNGRNSFLFPYVVRMPYYIFLGKAPGSTENLLQPEARKTNALSDGIKMENGLMTPESPWTQKNAAQTTSERIDGLDSLELGDSAWNGIPSRRLSTQSRNTSNMSKWRMPYEEAHIHKQFRTHIYGWTWEDPDCDVKKLDIKDGDSILAITSAGDNVLHYAAKADVRVHSVDMNPCQGHILELKLAAIRSLEYHDFWKIFGEGCHKDFEKLLSNRIAPHLSPQAYAYWQTNIAEFTDNFFLRGYSGWAVRLGKVAFSLAGVSGDVKKLINASTTTEQKRIYDTRLKPVPLNPVMKLILASPFFCWNALGVPKNQLNCLLADGSIEDFICATLDPVPGLSVLKTGAYHYFLCLNGKYTRSSCPVYLTYDGFQALKAKAGLRTDKISLHTETILNVLRSLPAQSLTKVIVMDSLDWFDPISDDTPLPPAFEEPPHVRKSKTPEEEYEDLKLELDYEILEMKRVLQVGGHAIWRSAGKYPWYRRRFELAGFKVEAVDVRENGEAIDRVNMYASLWRATRVA